MWQVSSQLAPDPKWKSDQPVAQGSGSRAIRSFVSTWPHLRRHPSTPHLVLCPDLIYRLRASRTGRDQLERRSIGGRPGRCLAIDALGVEWPLSHDILTRLNEAKSIGLWAAPQVPRELLTPNHQVTGSSPGWLTVAYAWRPGAPPRKLLRCAGAPRTANSATTSSRT
jgi:hypothetical protein